MADHTKDVALSSLRWFFLPLDETVYNGLKLEKLNKVESKVSPIYRGNLYRLNTLHNMETDLSRLPAPITGLKGLRAIQQGLHDVESAPNTVLYTQLSGFDERVHGYKCFGLLLYHPKNKVLIDVTIQIPEGYEDDNVILDVLVFVPDYRDAKEQLKRYIHYRRQSWSNLVNDHIQRTINSLLNLNCSNKEDKINFYKEMATRTIKAKRISSPVDLGK